MRPTSFTPSQSRLRQLPSELLGEIFSHGTLQDAKAVFESERRKPTCQELRDLAVRFKLPDAASLRVLIAMSKLSPQHLMQYCIEFDDFDSYQRLVRDYPDVEVVIPLIPDRGEFTRLGIVTDIERGSKLDVARLTAALIAKDDELVDVLLDLGVKPDEKSVLIAVETGNKRVLDAIEDQLVTGMRTSNADVIKSALDMGATGKGRGFDEAYAQIVWTPEIVRQMARTFKWADMFQHSIDSDDEAAGRIIIDVVGFGRIIDSIPAVGAGDQKEFWQASYNIGYFLLFLGVTPDELLEIGYEKYNYPIMDYALENGAKNAEIEAELTRYYQENPRQ